MKINELDASYLARILDNIREEVLKIILSIIINNNQINVNEFQKILIELEIPVAPELIKEIINTTRQLNNTVLFSADNYRLAVRLNEIIQKLHSLDFLSARKIVLEYLLKHIDILLKRSIKDAKIYRFFCVTLKPRFGLKINKSQYVRFIIKNLTDIQIPNVQISLQSSAEIEIDERYQYTSFQPGEQFELGSLVKPRVAKQIAISYKINGDFGEPIYVSADRENPFVPNNPVCNAHFVGREKELQYIREEIHQQHFLIFGPRRIGKTSLLFQLKEELKEGYIPIYVSLQTFSVVDSISLFDEILKKVTIELLEIKKISNPDLETIDNRIRCIKNCLEDEKVILLIDEMDVGQGLEKFHIFLEQMRVIMQQEGWLRIVLSSGPFITRDLIDPQSPLFNMVSHISVNRLTTEAAEKLLRLAEDQDIVFEKDVIKDCLQWTGNLPLYLQILGDHIYQYFKNKDVLERRVSQNYLTKIKQTMRNDIVEWERMWNMLNNIENPQIVHFSGHGRVEGALCFEDKLGRVHLVESEALSEMFKQFSDKVKCVILNSCYSKVQAEAIAKYIEYVIGMSQVISDPAAIAFATGFYQALGAGKAIEEAYKLGCIQIRLQGISEHLTPVLIKI